ncbi:MAG TPA: hypothetical protein VLG50_02625 [Candidatus Saccharimonadales bacterium]|nr:hypothetical protein [Candidatus Saccharimonadales bacterium]
MKSKLIAIFYIFLALIPGRHYASVASNTEPRINNNPLATLSNTYPNHEFSMPPMTRGITFIDEPATNTSCCDDCCKGWQVCCDYRFLCGIIAIVGCCLCCCYDFEKKKCSCCGCLKGIHQQMQERDQQRQQQSVINNART